MLVFMDMGINAQLVAVIAIGIAVLIYLARGVYRFFSTRESPARCGGCTLCEVSPGRRSMVRPRQKRR